MNKYYHSSSSWPMPLLNQNYTDNKIFLDLSFQRMACWSDSSKRSYINSIFEGVHPGNLILANVNANAHRNEYFKDLQEKGYMYLSIDGNNRTTCLSEFMNDKFTITHNGRKVTYSELDIHDKVQFDALSLGIVMYESIDKEGCAKIFLAHNESQALSAQEKRNAQIGEISSYVRELEPKFRSKIKTFDSENKKRGNDEFILDILLTELNPSSPTGKKDRDVYWTNNLPELKFNKTYLTETLTLLGEFLNIKNFGKQSSEGLAKDFIIVRGLMNQLDIVILDKGKFLTRLAELRSDLFNSRTLYEVLDKKGKEETYQYSSLVSLPAYANPLKKRAELLEKLLAQLQKENIVTFKTKRFVDTSDPILRKELFDRQNGTCLVSGKQIEDPLNGQLWEVDHIIPLAKGGTDTVDNMQLIDMVVNRKKGAKLLDEKVA